MSTPDSGIFSFITTGPEDLAGSCMLPVNDPPPPYPSRERRTRANRSNRRFNYRIQTTSLHTQVPSNDPEYDDLPTPHPPLSASSFPLSDEDDAQARETTPLLAPLSPRASMRRFSTRPRAYSINTVISSGSAAPSLARTIISLFQMDDDSDDEFESDDPEERHLLSPEDGTHRDQVPDLQPRHYSFFSSRAWRRYFRPLTHKAYYAALFHLFVLNFPYALAAWVYLFVFTLTGTALLMALPLGTVICFFNLLGARALGRGELALQSRFHGPLAYPPPHPPRPIFSRMREPTPAEIESGVASPGSLVPETSFYKKTYAMFTDSTSYQALFYFLVIKPSITLILSLLLIVFIPASVVLVIPAPPMFRAMRKLGIWQANVAIEGLYLAVR